MEESCNIVCSVIDEEKEFLNSVGQGIWRMPELRYKEFRAHAILTSALEKYGFIVHKHYFMPTAFRAEYYSRSVGGPTVAILLEYDALPGIGHACGHNLIAEAGLAAAVAIKAVMIENSKTAGKLVILGSPAQENGGGLLRLIELGAFENIDVALMAHPFNKHIKNPVTTSKIKGTAEFRGKESHAAAYPWRGKNALDAAVACYNGISLLRQQMIPGGSVNVIITEGGVATNIIPAKSRMDFLIRARTLADRKRLQSEVEACITGSATLTGCTAHYSFDEVNAYEDLINNRVLVDLYEKYATKLGIEFESHQETVASSVDVGNVSHLIPAICPFFCIVKNCALHTKAFNKASGSEESQEVALTVAKAIAMVAVNLMQCPEILKCMKEEFMKDKHDSEEASTI